MASTLPGPQEDLDIINGYLSAVSRGDDPRTIDVSGIDPSLRDIAEQAMGLGAAVNRLRSERHTLERTAYIDVLTGLANRAAYERDMAALWKSRTPHTIAFVDLDGLKCCNDHFGHIEGNRYLKAAAERLRLHAKPGERVYRIGGDEFMVLSRNATTEQLQERFEGCRESLSQLHMGNSSIPLSFSYGCAHADPGAGDDRRRLVDEADRRMYEYKLTNTPHAKRSDSQRDAFRGFTDFMGIQDRIFQAMALTAPGRYLFICNIDTNHSHWSRNAAHDFGLPDDSVYDMNSIWAEHVHPDDRPAWQRDIDDVFAGRKHHHSMRYRAKDAGGRYVMVTCTGIRLDGQEGEATLFVGSIVNSSIVESTDPATGVDDVRALLANITRRKDENRATDILAFKVAGLDRINTLYGYETGNRALSQLTGRVLSRAHGSAHLFRSYGAQFALVFDSQPEIELITFSNQLKSLLTAPVKIDGVSFPLEIHVVHARYAAITSQPLTVLSDINRRVDAVERTNTAATRLAATAPAGELASEDLSERIDGLTGLLRGNDFLYAADAHRARHPQENRALIALDLGHMRVYNEWYGRTRGDSLIAEVGSALQSLEADGLGFAGYWGQDDFVAYVPGSPDDIQRIYDRIAHIVSSRDDSIGFLPACGVCPVGHGERIDITLYDKAKSALKRAKNDFKERIKYFQPETFVKREEEHRMLSAFQCAINQGKIEFYLQPQVNIATGRIAGAEALARWREDDGTFVSPGVFVPLLERNGFAVTLDRSIWNQVFAWLGHRLAAGEPCVPVSINVSQIDLLSIDVADHLDCLAMKYAVPTSTVKVEITESAYVENPEVIGVFVERLHALGFSVYIDDFGSGSSSLSMLQDIEADVIKLDGRFMSKAGEEGKSENIVESVVKMAWTIGMPVVIEGVETQEQLDFLKGLGCRYVQGFYYYRPMPAGDFEQLIDKPEHTDPHGIYLLESQGGGRENPPTADDPTIEP